APGATTAALAVAGPSSQQQPGHAMSVERGSPPSPIASLELAQASAPIGARSGYIGSVDALPVLPPERPARQPGSARLLRGLQAAAVDILAACGQLHRATLEAGRACRDGARLGGVDLRGRGGAGRHGGTRAPDPGRLRRVRGRGPDPARDAPAG